ncbi:MAG TPA: acylphosphatase [Candidatus Eisenbacteria bacterium]|jgi:acylphosphatase
MATDMHRVHLLIHGRVQGVGFRYFALRAARALGIRGVVRNLADGAVEVEAEGEQAGLARLVVAMREGPAGARITRVDEDWSEGPARHAGFEIGTEGP